MSKLTTTAIVASLACLAALFYIALPRQENDSICHKALEKAQVVCLAAIETRATELETWYLCDKQHTAAMAEELNSLKGMWVMTKTGITGNEKERKAFFDDVSSKYLHTPQACEKETAKAIAAVLRDWCDAENELAVELKLPELTHEQADQKVESASVHTVDHTSSLQKQIAADIISLVGSEMTGACMTRLGVSAGILGSGAAMSAQTFGISLVVGVAVDLGVNWYMDTENKIKASLDEQVEKTAAEQKAKFREVMQKALEEQMNQWKEQLR